MDIDIKVVHERGDELHFEVEGLDLAFLNGLRRVIHRDVPIPAIRFSPTDNNNPDVQFVTNTGRLNNEIIGQRLSLTPLRFTAAQVDQFQRDDYRFVLRVKNTGTETVDVTTDDIKILSAQGVQQPKALHHQVFAHDPITREGILITKLKPNLYEPDKGEELHVEAWATVGTAHQHGAAFSPVSVCAFGAVVDEGLAVQALEAKRAELEATHKTRGLPPPSPEALAALETDFNALDRQRCFRKDRWGEPARLLFRLETVCGMSCKEIVLRALNVLSSRMGAIAGNVQDIIVRRAENGGYSLTIPNASHTEGNLLQSHLYDTRVEGEGVLEFAGYNAPHPLEEAINLRVVFKAAASEDDAIELVRKAAEEVGERVRVVRAAFEVAFAKM